MDRLSNHITDSTYEKELVSIQDVLSGSTSKDKGRYICFLESSLMASAISNEHIINILKNSYALYPDGVSATLLARIRNKKHFNRISGPTFMIKACEYGLQFGWKHFFYGANKKSNAMLVENLKKKFPDLIIAGAYSPPYRKLEDFDDGDVKLIEKTNPDLLWVSLGSPKQELWMAKHQGKIDVSIMLGIGAAFDFHSKYRPWAPRIIRKIGLEWIFRTFTGGIHIFRRNLVCLTKVSIYLLIHYIKTRYK
jgi:N-acetylglucosaminyldiphosphoundecaprenol N-acetyl-beta-D-mannosaminyltransferase